MAIKESEIQAQVKQYLQYRRWLVIRMQQNIGSHKGLADLYCLKDGRGVWVEVKTAKGRLSEHQEKFRHDIEVNGGEYVVARDVADVEHLG